MKIVVGSDHSGYELKSAIATYLSARDYKVIDVGSANIEPCDYPDFASKACENILEKICVFGVLVCGTGIGMSIAANRHSQIRAALCVDTVMAIKARQHNDANILVLGEKLVSPEEAQQILEAFLATPFEGGRHSARLAKIS